MPQEDILTKYGISREEIDREVDSCLQDLSAEQLEVELDESVRDYTVNTLLSGRIVNITDDDVMIDVGYKSEGVVPKSEWQDPSQIEPGQTVEVLLEAVEDDSGVVQLSKRKADRIRSWQRIVTRCSEGDIVTGRVLRKIKGGLLVDIGVPVFLPASQVDIRRPAEIADYIGHLLTCRILKIDEDRRNIVVSRRQLIEHQRQIMQQRLFPKLIAGETRSGKVKNIVDFGAFVDLGGIDGLLHITDMSWGRISHPSEMVAIDDEIEVRVLNVDQEKGKVALGLKQKTPSPWETIEDKYPVGTTVGGEVVNLMSYGAFVKLEEGIEGLVHISEMSWTRRVNHPSEVVAIGDVVDIVVLGIDHQKQQISLGMKQTEPDPWGLVAQNYPPGTPTVGRVRNLTSYGAFVEIEEGIDGLLHVSDMSWTRKVSHPSEVLKKGDTVETVVLEVDSNKRRLALGLKQLQPDPWGEDIPARYKAGDLVRGVVSKLTSFGAFVELEEGLEGLLHISELSDKKISSPEEILAVGDVVDVRIIRMDPEARKIGLSLRTDAQAEGAEGGPRLVMRNEEVEAAENSREIVEKALEQAPRREESALRPTQEGVGLNLPVEAAAPDEVPQVEPEQATEPAAEPAAADALPPEMSAPDQVEGEPEMGPEDAFVLTEETPPGVPEGEEAPQTEPEDEGASEVQLDSEEPAQVKLEESDEEEPPPPPPPPPPVEPQS